MLSNEERKAVVANMDAMADRFIDDITVIAQSLIKKAVRDGIPHPRLAMGAVGKAMLMTGFTFVGVSLGYDGKDALSECEIAMARLRAMGANSIARN